MASQSFPPSLVFRDHPEPLLGGPTPRGTTLSDIQSDDPPVLILGSGITALGVQRVLGRRGIPYYNAGGDDPLLKRSRWYRPLPDGWTAPTSDDLEAWLSRVDLPRAVLFPCSDRWAMSVARIAHQPGDRFPASVPCPEALQRLVDKESFHEALLEFEIPHPWTVEVSGPGDIESLPDDRFVDLFFKPRDSQRFMELFGVKALRVTCAGDALGKLAELGTGDFGLVLQEYIPGPATNHYFIDGFRDSTGEIATLFARQRLRMYPPDFGNSSLMKSVPLDQVAGAVTSLRRLLDGVGHRGVFSAEFKRDPRDGEFKILEVNARAWWYVEFAEQCGVDVCGMAYADALGRPVGEVHEYAVGRRCVYPYHDYFICQDLRRHGELSLRAWASSWVGAHQPVFQWADPWPGLRTTLGVLSGRLGKRLRTGTGS